MFICVLRAKKYDLQDIYRFVGFNALYNMPCLVTAKTANEQEISGDDYSDVMRWVALIQPKVHVAKWNEWWWLDYDMI